MMPGNQAGDADIGRPDTGANRRAITYEQESCSGVGRLGLQQPDRAVQGNCIADAQRHASVQARQPGQKQMPASGRLKAIRRMQIYLRPLRQTYEYCTGPFTPTGMAIYQLMSYKKLSGRSCTAAVNSLGNFTSRGFDLQAHQKSVPIFPSHLC